MLSSPVARPLSDKEIRTLKKIARGSSPGGWSLFRTLLWFVVPGAVSLYITTIIPDSFFTFVFGTISVIGLAAIVFGPLEVIRQRRASATKRKAVEAILARGTVSVWHIKVSAAAIAGEYEDEGIMHVIGTDRGTVVYLWDQYDGLMGRRFPCAEFEIVEKQFAEVIGRKINPLGAKIIPVKISPEAKWNYMSSATKSFEDMEEEEAAFEDVVARIDRPALSRTT